jgi:hypothetical protein
MLNKVLLIGTLLDPPLLDPSGMTSIVVRFSLQVEPASLPACSEKQKRELFLVQASGDLGHRCLHELDRGALVFVEGRLVQGGNEQEQVWVEASEVELLAAPGEDQALVQSGFDTVVVVFGWETTAVLIGSLERMPPVAFLPYRYVPPQVRWIELESVPAVSSVPLPFQAVGFSRHGQRVSCHLFQVAGEVMSLVLAPDEDWTVEFQEQCTALSCPLLSRNNSQQRMRATRVQAVASRTLCSCASAATQAFRLLSLIGHVYEAEGIVVTELRQLPPILQRWERSAFGEDAAQAGSIRCVRLSLLARAGHTEQEGGSARTPEKRGRSPSASPKRSAKSFAPYHRILVPGEQKPWRRFQVIYVTPRRTEEHVRSAHDQ